MNHLQASKKALRCLLVGTILFTLVALAIALAFLDRRMEDRLDLELAPQSRQSGSQQLVDDAHQQEAHRVLPLLPPKTVNLGTLVILWQHSFKPVAGAGWCVRGESGAVVTCHSNLHGELRVPEGHLQIEPMDHRIILLRNRCIVSSSSTDHTVLWAAKRGDICVTVKDLNGQPITGAQVTCSSWTNTTTSQYNMGFPRKVAPPVHSDDKGRAMLQGLPLAGLDIFVGKDRFVASVVKLVAPAPEVNVVLYPESDLELLRIIAADTGRYVDGVTADCAHGLVTMTKTSAGLYNLHMSSGRGARIWLEAPGYCRTELLLPKDSAAMGDPQHPTEVRMRRAGSITIKAESASGSVLVWPIMAPGSKTHTWLPEYLKFRVPGTAEFRAPIGATITLIGVSDEGSVAEHELLVRDSENLAVMPFLPSTGVELRAASQSDHRLDRLRVTVNYEPGVDLQLRSRRDNASFVVCKPEMASEVRVEAAGHEVRELRRVRENYIVSSGLVTAKLAKSFRTELELTASTGEPLAGVIVSLRGDDLARAFAEYPHLAGNWPCEDANWAWRHQPGRVLVTDGRGRVSFMSTPGTYWLELGIPGEVSGKHWSLFKIRDLPAKLTLEHAGVKRLVIDAIRRTVLTVSDALNGRPMDRIRVTAGIGPLRHGLDLIGREHTFFLPLGVSRIRVGAKEYVSTIVDIEDGKAVYHVQLWPKGYRPDNGVTVSFFGPGAASVKGKRLTLVGVREGFGVNKTVVWRQNVMVDETGQATVFISVPGPLMIDAIADDPRLSFVGPSVLWREGMRLHFSVTRKP